MQFHTSVFYVVSDYFTLRQKNGTDFGIVGKKNKKSIIALRILSKSLLKHDGKLLMD